MWIQTYENMEKCYDDEVFETINDAYHLGVLTMEMSSHLITDKKEGMRWVNDAPYEVEEDFGERASDDIDFLEYQWEDR